MSPVGLNSPREGDSRGSAKLEGVGRGKRRSWAVRSVGIGLRTLVSLFSQCRSEPMRWMWMGLWKMTWAKAEKGLERMMKLSRGWYPGRSDFERVSLSTSNASEVRCERCPKERSSQLGEIKRSCQDCILLNKNELENLDSEKFDSFLSSINNY